MNRCLPFLKMIALSSGFLTGCSKRSETVDTKLNSEIAWVQQLKNSDPKCNLEKIYKAYKVACEKLGSAPANDGELITYLKNFGDATEILKGINTVVQFNKRSIQTDKIVMAWEKYSDNDQYHALLYSGDIVALTSYELDVRGRGVEKRSPDQIKKEATAARRLSEEAEKKLRSEMLAQDEESLRVQDRNKAEFDFVGLRNRLPAGMAHEQLLVVETDWIGRRAAVYEAARKSGKVKVNRNLDNIEYLGNIPLPSEQEILNALGKGSNIPVAAGEIPVAVLGPPAVENPPLAKQDAKKPGKKTEVDIALGKKVTLKSPYPQVNPNDRTDKISVQSAIKELLRQVGLEMDIEKSRTNIGEIARKYISPTISDEICQAAIEDILKPLGASYRIENGKLVLIKK